MPVVHGHNPSRPKTKDILPYLREYLKANPLGGSLHIVTEDGNYNLGSRMFCLQHAIEQKDQRGIVLAYALCQMSRTQVSYMCKFETLREPLT